MIKEQIYHLSSYHTLRIKELVNALSHQKAIIIALGSFTDINMTTDQNFMLPHKLNKIEIASTLYSLSSNISIKLLKGCTT